MNPNAWERLQALFFGALDRDPEERAAFLEAACADEPALRAEVEAMLGAHESGQGLLLEGRLLAGAAALPDADALVGTRIGAYRLTSLLGQGGMGAVYLAERADAQYRQAVALKLIRPGLHTADVVARFRVERQILARLEYPSIARLIDGGLTDDGLPYLVMEYVAGTPITAFCDAHRLPIRERLRLFRTVCEAVQFAHRNLVVHRDLKPSNILVVDDEGGARVKLLDFGIAKLLDPTGAGPVTMPLTRAEVRLLTPEYAAPEQVRGEAVTTATDVYALGVLLYELLTGHRPYRLPERRQAEVERVICEEEPTRPSTAVAEVEEVTQGDGTTETLTPERVSAARSTAFGRLRRTLQGDLDNIVLMALRKEPERRYASAEGMAEDVRRHLVGLPVQARPDAPLYRVGKFVRRHRVGVGAAALVVLSLAGGLAVALWQARVAAAERDRARLEAAKAEQVSAFMVGLFEASDRMEEQEQLTAEALLDRGAARAEALAEQPAVQAQMLASIGQAYWSLGRFDRAAPLLERDLALQRSLHGDVHEEVARSLARLARLRVDARGDYDTIRPLYEEALAIFSRLDPEHTEIISMLNALAGMHFLQGEYEEAERRFREVLGLVRTRPPEERGALPMILNNFGLTLIRQEKLDEAEPLLREALARNREEHGEEHPNVATNLNILAEVHLAQGRLAEAEALLLDVLDRRKRLYGEEHVAVAAIYNNLAQTAQKQNRLDEAEAYARNAIAIQRKAQGPKHPLLALGLKNFGMLLTTRGQYEEAEAALLESLAIYREAFGDTHPQVGFVRDALDELGTARGQPEKAAQ